MRQPPMPTRDAPRLTSRCKIPVEVGNEANASDTTSRFFFLFSATFSGFASSYVLVLGVIF